MMIFFAIAKAQVSESQEVFVQSWQHGTEIVHNQIFRVPLSPKLPEYTTVVVGSNKKYKLNIIHNSLSNVKTEHWKIELREIKLANDGKEVLGDNLLTMVKPGPGRDYFPREDLIGYLYPEKETPMVRIGGVPYVEGYPFYSIKMTRKIRVEGFHLIASVENYQFSNTDKSKLDFLDLIIEFQNAYNQDSLSNH
jgi:hypothetical protein